MVTFNLSDLSFILTQIKIAEAHSAGTPLTELVTNPLLPFGLRTVDGTFNNLVPGRETWGSADQPFPRLVPADYGTGTAPPPGTFPVPGNQSYDPSNPSNVIDTAPRTISNLIVDQTANNPAAIYAALEFIGITGNAARTIVNSIAPLTEADRAAHRLEAAYLGAVAATGAGITTATNAKAAVDALLAVLQDDVTNDDGLVDAGETAAAAAALSAANRAVSSAQSAVTALQHDAGVNPADLAAANSVLASAQALASQIATLTAALAIGSTIDPTDIADATTASGDAALNISAITALNAALVAPKDAAVLAAEATAAAVESAVTAAGIELNDNGTLSIPNIAPDVGISAPFNSWMTLFGQFFDHGLDLVEKTAETKVYVPLQPDDPLYVPGGNSNFMVITRTVENARNVTTPFVDQNQTYTSHASHQVFLREYAGAPGAALSTGHLLEHATGGLATWADIKAQAKDLLGIVLTDADVHNVPVLATDLYGEFERGPNGFAQILVQTGPNTFVKVEGTATGITLVEAAALAGGTVALTGHAFINDIAHHAAPGFVDLNHDGLKGPGEYDQVADANFDRNDDGIYDASDLDFDNDGSVTASDIQSLANANLLSDVNHDGVVSLADVDRNSDNDITAADFDINGDGIVSAADLTADDRNANTYDNELLEAHYVTGDGRGNENIGLTTVHHVFHSEHNRLVEHTKDVAVASNDVNVLKGWMLGGDTFTAQQVADLQAQLTTINGLTGQAKADAIDALGWDGERLFQAARFGTEMQYQHLVFEEFARKVNPAVDLFVFNPTVDINPAIVAEFAHTVYRFGHSMLNETVDRLGADGQTSNDIGLIEAFLNPVEFASEDADVMAGSIIRGMTRQRGNEIDEFVTEALRNNLLGLPLDLATVNLARGRETGVPSLQEARAAFYDEAKSEWLKPYTSWVDFAQHLKNPASIVNFVAAYGNHEAILAATTLEDKRKAAMAIVFGDNDGTPNTVLINGTDYDISNRVAFLNGSSGHAALGGLNDVDLWIGGLAESILPFGGMLGSTFTFVFEKQLESLQNGDRFYYLSRTQGTHFVQELENNSFAKLVMLNTDLGAPGHTHLPGELFAKVDYIIEMNQALQSGADPTHEDPFLQALEPKVARDQHLTIDGNTYDRSLKFTGEEHIVLGGSEDDDVLIADLGDDTVWGDGGDDYIEGGHGINRLHGGTGDDIIYGGGDAEFLHGEEGDDVINGGNGLGDLIFGGDGNDFVVGGIDGKEVFAAEGNDFILGSPDVDFLLGGEGDDWIEGAEGFDTIAGENSELFFNSPIIGHDVMFAGTNEQDFDAESGDDIMVQGESVMRNEGMLGFDWVSFEEHNSFGADADMRVKIFTTVAADILRNRFDRVEAMSGSKFADILVGDERTSPTGPINPNVPANEATLDGDQLTREGVLRIDGLAEVLGMTEAQVAALPANSVVFDAGNILIGGDGGDRIQGNGGNDVIDGDARLNVRIGINDANDLEIGTAEKMQGAVHFYTAAEAAALGAGYAAAGVALLARQGDALDTLMFDRTIKPSQLEIVREILNDTTQNNAQLPGFDGDVDIAIFRDVQANYTVVNNGNGTYTVTHLAFDRQGNPIPGEFGIDGVDTIRNIEVLQFADGTINIGNVPNNAATGAPAIAILTDSPGAGATVGVMNVGDTLRANVGNLADPDNVTAGNPLGLITAGVTFAWQVEETPGNWVALTDPVTGVQITSASVTLTPLLGVEDLRLRVVASFVDANGFPEFRISAPTAPIVSAGPTAPDPAAVLGLDLSGQAVDGVVQPAGTIGIVEDEIDANPATNLSVFTITRDALLANVTDIDTPTAQLILSNLVIRVRDGDPAPGVLSNIVTDAFGIVSADFDPAQDFNGGIVFTFDVSDGTTTTPMEATLDVLPVNDAPVPVPQPLGSGPPNQAITFTEAQLFGGILRDANGDPTDVDGDLVEIDPAVAVALANPAQGTLIDNGDGTWTFTPALGFAGTVTVTYALTDGTVSVATSSTIQIVNNAPVGQPIIIDPTPTNGLVSPTEGQSLSVDVTGISDPDGIGTPIAVQWQVSTNGGATWTNIAGATNATFTPGQAQVGGLLRVQATFNDANGVAEAVNSAPSGVVGDNFQAIPVVANTFVGTAGDDVAVGTNGILGGLIGANDTFTGNGGNDQINGQGGTDTAVFNGPVTNFAFGSSNAPLVVTDLSGADGVDSLTNIEQLRFGGAAGTTYTVTAGTAAGQTVNGGAGIINGNRADILFGFAGVDTLNGNGGNDVLVGGTDNDTANGGAGDDIILWRAGDGRDFVDGGANASAAGDLVHIAGDSSAETFTVYSIAAAALAGFTPTNANTEVIVVRNGAVIAELDNVEELVINGLGVTTPGGAGGGTSSGDTINVEGSFAGTSLNFNTITIEGGDGNDTVNITGLTSGHRIVFNSGGGNDTIIGTLRPQDVIQVAPGTNPADYTTTHQGGQTIVSDGTNTITFSGTGTPQLQSAPSEGGEPNGFKLTQSDLATLKALVNGQQPAGGDDEIPTGVRTLDGHGNNLAHPTHGAAEEPFIRITTPHYGAENPATGNRDINPIFAGLDPRNISNILGAQEADLAPNAKGANIFFMAFGQYFDHGLDFLGKGGNGTIAIGGIGYNPATGNPADLTRGTVSGWDGATPQHLNHTSPYVDQNQAYGSHELVGQFLREGDGSGGLGAHLFQGGPDPSNTAFNLLPTLAELIQHHWANNTVFHAAGLPGGEAAFRDYYAGLVDANGHIDQTMANALNANFMGSGQILVGDANPFVNVLDHYVAGDLRANENVTLTSIHTVWSRNHNFHADNLTAAGFEGTAEELFQAAKILNEAEYQRVVFGEFADMLIGGIRGNGSHGHDQYNPNATASISHEFAAAVYRVGHSLIGQTITVMDENGHPKQVSLVDAFLNPTNEAGAFTGPLPPGYVPQPGFEQLGVDNIIGGIVTQAAEEVDFNLVDAVRNDLVRLHADLFAFNVARGWDVGLGTLNQIRHDLASSTDPYIAEARSYAGNLDPYTSWEDFQARNGLSNAVIDQFKQAYPDLELAAADIAAFRAINPDIDVTIDAVTGNGTVKGIDRVDVWVGGLAEAHINNGMVGQTFWVVLHEQFDRLQEADRFYYTDRLENLDLYQNFIDGTNFSDIIARNTGLDNLPEDIFETDPIDEPENTAPYAPALFALAASAEDAVRVITEAELLAGAGDIDGDDLDIVDLAIASGGGSLVQSGSSSWIYTPAADDDTGVTFTYKVSDGAASSGLVTATLDLLPMAEPVAVNPLIGNGRKNVIDGGSSGDEIWGRGNDDLLRGNGGDDKIYGESGSDRLLGGNGDDELWGGSGNDTLRGQSGDDTLYGGDGRDQLVGGDGQDEMRGGGGNDLVIGGDGRDEMWGGAGRDTFSFDDGDTGNSAGTRDVIWDFQGAGNSSGDLLDLRGIDAIAGGGDSAFTFIGSIPFYALGQLRVTFANGKTIVEGNTTGDPAADLQIELAGHHNLIGSDFVL